MIGPIWLRTWPSCPYVLETRDITVVYVTTYFLVLCTVWIEEDSWWLFIYCNTVFQGPKVGSLFMETASLKLPHLSAPAPFDSSLLFCEFVRYTNVMIMIIIWSKATTAKIPTCRMLTFYTGSLHCTNFEDEISCSEVVYMSKFRRTSVQDFVLFKSILNENICDVCTLTWLVYYFSISEVLHCHLFCQFLSSL